MTFHVIGTAGHVDHGKSTLVLALTGIDPDRLAEEKAREMTIDLGFAWLTLGEDEVGIIDVPGHRDFIENMLAGVGGIDLALLVIAADEGVMPQTREHLAILDLLSIEHGVIALTKTDLIDDPEWLEMLELEVSEALSGTSFAGAPIIPVSARTGSGLAELKQCLSDNLHAMALHQDLGRPRLSIDRVFSLAGFGTIVTGTLLDGSFRVGDSVEILPGKLSARIRGIQSHKTKRDIAQPGSRVAINITGVDREELHRGQIVALPGALRETRLLDVLYRHLPDAGEPMAHNTEVKVFIGAAEVKAHTRIIGQEEITPGHEGWVQLALDSPVAAVRNDRLILRRPSPGATIGGGKVLDPNPGRRHRRFKKEVLDRFTALTSGTPDELLLFTLEKSGPVTVEELCEKSGLTKDLAATTLDNLVKEKIVVMVGRFYMTVSYFNHINSQINQVLANYHRENPLRRGMDRKALRIVLGIQTAAYSAILDWQISSGLIVEDGPAVRLPTHEITFSAEDQQKINQLESALAQQPSQSLSAKECKAITGEPLYHALVDTGILKPVNQEVVYPAAVYDQIVSSLVDYLLDHQTVTAAEVRDLFGTSRKYAIALLEHLDENGITRRVGDARELVPRRKNA